MESSITLLHIRELAPGRARGIEARVGNEVVPLILVRHEEGVSAYRNRCPHAGTPLDWVPDQFFDPEGTHLQCATHAALFDPRTGACVAGPCAGEALESFHVILDGEGYVRLVLES